MKKLYFLTVLVLAICATAQITFTQNNLKYTQIGTTNNVNVGQGATPNTGALSIPSSVINAGISYNVTEIKISGFEFTTITSVVLPNSITTINDNAFSYCTSLNAVTIPNSVSVIKSSAFINCRVLQTLTIPNSVTSIGDGAFAICVGLTSINVSWGTPLAIPVTVFNNVQTNAIKLVVPAGKVPNYQAAAVWKNFNPIQEASTLDVSVNDAVSFNHFLNPNTGILKINYAKNIGKVSIYSLTGQILLEKNTSGTAVKVDISSLLPAVYFVKIITADSEKTFKIIKK